MWKPPTTLNDIAYDVHKRFGYTIYIQENDEYVPYLVLTNKYNDNVLLLRKHLLDELIEFDDYDNTRNNDRHSNYYKDSYIDIYLNETFLPQINEEVQKIIIDSEIIIKPKQGTKEWEKSEMEQIQRNVFILSTKEVGFFTVGYDDEGITLKYFKDDNKRQFARSRNKATTWWLRTSCNRFYDYADVVVSDRPGGGNAPVSREFGVRPAFCLPRDTAIYEEEVNFEKRYMIALE